MGLKSSGGAGRPLIYWIDDGCKYTGNEIADLIPSQIREVVGKYVGLDSLKQFTTDVLPFYCAEDYVYNRDTYPRLFSRLLAQTGSEKLSSYCESLDNATRYFDLFRKKGFRSIGIYGNPYGLVGTNLLMFLGMLNDSLISPQEFISIIGKLRQVLPDIKVNEYISKSFFFHSPENLRDNFKSFSTVPESRFKGFKDITESLGINITAPTLPPVWFERCNKTLKEMDKFSSESHIHEFTEKRNEQLREEFGDVFISEIKRTQPMEYLLLLFGQSEPFSSKSEGFSRKPLFFLDQNIAPPYTFLSPSGRSRFTLWENSLDSVKRHTGLTSICEKEAIEDDQKGKDLLEKLESRGYCVKEKDDYPRVCGFSMVRATVLPRGELEKAIENPVLSTYTKGIFGILYTNLLESFKSSRSFHWTYKEDGYQPVLKRYLRKIRAVNPPLHERNEYWEYQLLDLLSQSVSFRGSVMQCKVREFYTDFCQNVDSKVLCRSSFDVSNNLFENQNISSDGLSFRVFMLEKEHELFGVKIIQSFWRDFKVRGSWELTPADILDLCHQLENNTMQAILAEQLLRGEK